RTYVKVHDGLPDHPKIIEAGGEAGWLYICGLAYSSRQLTDGVEGAPASLFLTGNIGVGKTHTAWHTARRWLDNQYRGG
ncbi:hypothetical protein KBZ21_43465, partial [Streptomyces sp. A73]|nr:hypothetical protein [Streptomyces sp. A73]